MKESERDVLRSKIENAEFLGYEERVIHADELSSKMLHKHRTSLNVISHDAAIELVRSAIRRGVVVSEVYVDTVGDPKKYAAKFRDAFPALKKVVVEKKADGTYPIVGSASIVAKTTRDRCLREWVFKEEFKEEGLSEKFVNFSRKLGSGYPGDPSTKAWLRDHLDPIFGFPTLVRFSWSTAKKLLDERAMKVEWEYESDDEEMDVQGTQSITNFFGKKAKSSLGKRDRTSVKESVAPRPSWLRTRTLFPATSL